MNKVPWWYWPIALVPVAICAIVGLAVFSLRTLAGVKSVRDSADSCAANIAMAFSLYAALVLLGYLLLILCGPTRDPNESADRDSAR